MNERQLIWNTEPSVEIEIQQTRPASAASLPFASAQAHRKLRLALPLPRRESCLTRRAMLAALGEAELAAWQASGGDSLRA
jgi:hypothetical protein